jgi:hypothetical protein
MSVVGGWTNATYTHIEGIGEYNERLFRDLDNLLATASRNGIRLVIPFIDNWEWWGGVHQFCAMYQVTRAVLLWWRCCMWRSSPLATVGDCSGVRPNDTCSAFPLWSGVDVHMSMRAGRACL